MVSTISRGTNRVDFGSSKSAAAVVTRVRDILPANKRVRYKPSTRRPRIKYNKFNRNARAFSGPLESIININRTVTPECTRGEQIHFVLRPPGSRPRDELNRNCRSAFRIAPTTKRQKYVYALFKGSGSAEWPPFFSPVKLRLNPNRSRRRSSLSIILF